MTVLANPPTAMDALFEARRSTKGADVGIRINGVDISNRYEILATGSAAAESGFRTGGADLNTLFCAKGTAPLTWTTPDVLVAGDGGAILSGIAYMGNIGYIAAGVRFGTTGYYVFVRKSSNGISGWNVDAYRLSVDYGSIQPPAVLAAFSTGQILVVHTDAGGQGTFTYSTDGVTWGGTMTVMGTGGAMYAPSVCLLEGAYYVAVGDSGSGTPVFAYAAVSDQYTWSTPAAMHGTANNFIPTDVVSTGSRVVAVGYNSSTYAAMFSYTDGLPTWSLPASMGLSEAIRIQSVAWNGSLLVAVGYTEATSRAVYTTSTDGSTWTAAADIGAATSAKMYGVVWRNDRFVAVGALVTGTRGYAATSPAGTSWTTLAAMGTSTVFIPAALATNTTQCVAVGGAYMSRTT